ncbi:hypothetical protein [Paraburkholderia hospita]|nr:hypothetical protein [Paraburkholderia hospita]
MDENCIVGVPRLLAGRKLPAILITAYADDEKREKMMVAGAQG